MANDKEHVGNASFEEKKKETYIRSQERVSVKDKIKELTKLCVMQCPDSDLIRLMKEIQDRLPDYPDQKLYYESVTKSYPVLSKLRKELEKDCEVKYPFEDKTIIFEP